VSQKGSPFLRPVCPCVPLCGTGGVVAGQGSLERICPDFGQRKKGDIGNQYLPKGTLTDAKNVCSPAIFVNIVFTKRGYEEKSVNKILL
jgi:hypothetical protein